MPAKHITAKILVLKKPNAECCDCSLEVADSPEEEIWTIWNEHHIYCPRCAKNEGIGPDRTLIVQ